MQPEPPNRDRSMMTKLLKRYLTKYEYDFFDFLYTQDPVQDT